jgi:hypothetical protein
MKNKMFRLFYHQRAAFRKTKKRLDMGPKVGMRFRGYAWFPDLTYHRQYFPEKDFKKEFTINGESRMKRLSRLPARGLLLSHTIPHRRYFITLKIVQGVCVCVCVCVVVCVCVCE